MTDSDNIHHLETCPYCHECQFLMAFYAICEDCFKWGHISTLYSVPDIDVNHRVLICQICMENRTDGTSVLHPL
jgi:hypothetical protein